MQICYFSNHQKQDLREGSGGGELTGRRFGAKGEVRGEKEGRRGREKRKGD